MLRARVIPVLLLRDESLVKTTKFRGAQYIGDPCNTMRIFNELEVDELAFLDTTASVRGRPPNLSLLRDLADECFMPVAYGGGITTAEQARQILQIGFEKVIINTHAHQDPSILSRLAEEIGSQSVIVSIDVKRGLGGRATVRTEGGRRNTGRDPVNWGRQAAALGAGEILLTSIDREGSWLGFDLELVRSVVDAVPIPVIANGGAGCVEDIGQVICNGGASAAAVGSMVVYQGKGRGVLVNFPTPEALRRVLEQPPQPVRGPGPVHALHDEIPRLVK